MKMPKKNEIDLCELELILNYIKKYTHKFEIISSFEKNDINLATINLNNDTININNKILKTKKANDKESRIIVKNKTHLVNALMRCSLIKPKTEGYKREIAEWDDIILGLDTNVFYNCALTSFILDEFVKIPSDDFIDSPDWVTFVFSKIGMGEIENMANIKNADKKKRGPKKRQALRAIQEIMLINKAKDLEGVSIFLAGNIPPEINFTEGKNTTRDSIIRDQYRIFLKNLDFHKGNYFITEDFNNSVLAEAEGLRTMYLKKPKLKEKYNLYKNKKGSKDKVNFSELLYELAVSFNPLIIKSGKINMKIYSNWPEKTLEEWENWKIELKWIKISKRIRKELNKKMKNKTSSKILKGWETLKKRNVTLGY